MALDKADGEENRSHAERGYVPLSGTGILFAVRRGFSEESNAV